jgi:hypothetical protein
MRTFLTLLIALDRGRLSRRREGQRGAAGAVEP